MRRLAVAVLLLFAAAIAAVVVLNRSDDAPGTAPALVGAPGPAGALARGEYLTRAADCVACHTAAAGGRPFAGGVAFRLPFGTIYSSNITADPETGIGRWTDADFLRALHDGVRADGQHLYPAFPYTAYTQLSRDDVLAIKTYLFSLPPVRQPVPRNDLKFPFNQRWAMSVWNAAFFKDQRFAPDAARSAQWNSGAYLATALGHCAECHTPRNAGFGLEHGKEFSGAELQGWRAYNITADPRYGIGSWSDGELAQYLSSGHADGHASASGPMGEAVAHSLQYLNPADVAALVVYLRTIPAREGEHPIDIDAKPAPATASSGAAPGGDAAGAQSEGLKLFEGACASCHEWDGMGRQTPYAAFLGTRSVNDRTGANVTEAILQGAAFRIGDSDVFMPAFAGAYSDTEVAALTDYVIAHFGDKQGTVTPQEVGRRRSL
jgi:mono/diheme cytochrome c family protein